MDSLGVILPNDLKTDELELGKIGFIKEGLDQYIELHLQAKGWKVEYSEELNGYYICQQYNPTAFIPCVFLVDIIKFGTLVGVDFIYKDN